MVAVKTKFPAEWTKSQRDFFLVAFCAGFAWNLAILLCSTGWSLDDELSHFLRSRSVWEDPALIFDSWTRIGRNLFHVIPSHFGLTAARLWTLGAAALAVLITTSLAVKFGVRRAWLIPLALWFQPWFVELSWGVLTQTPFMLCLVTGIWFGAGRRWILASLCFGTLPLIRHEGLALFALWGIALAVLALVFRRTTVIVLFLAGAVGLLPLLFSNFAAWAFLGELPSRIFLNSKPTDIYGHGALWHFLPVSFFPAGPFTIFLAAPALPWLLRQRANVWLLIFYPAYLALHSVIFWLGLFASGGYYHFLMPLAPGLAIAAVIGANVCLDAERRWMRIAGRALLAGAVIQGLVLLHVHAMQYWAGSTIGLGLTPEPIHASLQKALDWQKANRPDAPVVVSRHIYCSVSRDWIERRERVTLNNLLPAQLPKGAIVIWETKYSDLTGMPLATLQTDWRELQSFNEGTVRIFEKTDSR